MQPFMDVNATGITTRRGQRLRQSAAETLNGWLEAAADRLCRAGRHRRSAERAGTRAGHAAVVIGEGGSVSCRWRGGSKP
jgi:hypothetical protein